MHLKSIELYGFKSFANKMVFKFDQGITAIVGPNGSGKSNVADAVRWVLGEQSAKQLRGSKMQDVIFAGTEARKPLGYCQVDLTIDNHDMKMPIEYSEVTVSRRVYRSGEGEYFINGTNCRMRDVLELFMDTGVGQEGYSIIGQGQIDKILSNKPEERRALFDEAVGIVKFKKRKERAEKKLDEEKQNLYRINDIITELAGQKTTLMDQAEKAKSFLKDREELRKNEVNIFIMDVKKIDEQLLELEEKTKIIEEDIAKVRIDYQNNKLKHNAYIEKIEVLEQEIEGLRGRSTEFTVLKEKKESEIKLTLEQISHLTSNNQRFETDIRELEGRRNQSELDLHAYEDNIKTLFENSESSDQRLKAHEIKLLELNKAIESEEKSVGDIQSNMIERLNEISTIKTKMQRFHTMVENTTSRKESIDARHQILSRSIEAIRFTLKDDIKTKDVLAREANDLNASKETLVSEQASHSQQLFKVEKERKESISQLGTLESKYKALTEISDQYEGYNLSIKKVMTQKVFPELIQKVCGVVADVLKVDQKYERSIEIALGGNYQNIITEDEHAAKKLIQYLKDHKYGRATFLPLTNINPKVQKNDRLEKEIGFIGYGDELVEVEEKFRNIARYLLGRIVIATDIDSAIKMGKKYNNTLRIVTLDGDQVNPGGSLTGGAFKNNNTQFLARKRELEDLKGLIDEQQNALGIIDTDYQELLLLKTKQDEAFQKIQERLQELTIDLNGRNMKIHQLKSEIVKGDSELNELDLEADQLSRQEGDLTLQLSTLEMNLNENEVNKDQEESTVKDLMATTIQLKKDKDLLVEQITTVRVEHTALTEQRINAQGHIDRMKFEIKDLMRQINRLSEDVRNNETVVAEKSSFVEAFKVDVVSYDGSLMVVNQKVQELNVEKQGLNKAQESLYKSQEELSEKITLLEKDGLRLQNIVAKYELQKDTYIDYMWNEYELTYNNAMQFMDETLGSLSVVKKNIERLKAQIKELGDVNVNAIEDFKAVNERHTFLTEQKNDLIEAEEKLREVIAELDEQMQTQFREQFKAINIEFQKVFKELFGGGKAFLRLSDEEQVLEAGIHINVQPPGKKLQSMMLLSGGERAFTAIALLFAIQSLKPSPFCVLDEIEAALDDANVDRFAQYLKKLTVNTQFIIITHRRGTMEASDALYGITMQEKGISTQVSVKLIEDVLE